MKNTLKDDTMSLTKKLILAFAATGMFGGCGITNPYLKPTVEIDAQEKRIRLFDKNKDSKWDTVLITLKNKGITYAAEDTDFNGSWDKLCSYSKFLMAIGDGTGPKKILKKKGTIYTEFLDKDNDGNYEIFSQTMETPFGKNLDIILKDTNGDGIFDEFIDNLSGDKSLMQISLDKEIKEHLEVLKESLEYIKKSNK